MDKGYCLSRLCSRVVIYFNFVVRDVIFLSSELMSLQMKR